MHDFHHGRFVGAGVVFGDEANRQACHQADDGREENADCRHGFGSGGKHILVLPAIGEHPFDDEIRCDKHDDRRAIDAPVQGRLRVAAFFYPHEEGAHDGGEYPYARQHHWQKDCIQPAELVGIFITHDANERCTQHHRANDGADVALEQVGAHAAHVAHVVAHIVGDGGGVERVVFRNARFHFADEVGAHVRSFCINAATYPCKQRNRGCAKGKSCHHGDDLDEVPAHIAVNNEQGA